MFSEKHQNEVPSTIGRRTFLGLVGGAAIALVWSYFQRRQPVHAAFVAPSGPPKMVKIVMFTDAGQRQDTVTVPDNREVRRRVAQATLARLLRSHA